MMKYMLLLRKYNFNSQKTEELELMEAKMWERQQHHTNDEIVMTRHYRMIIEDI